MSWHEVHARVCARARGRAAEDYEDAALLLLAWRLRVDRRVEAGSFHEYAERYFGLDARAVRERLRVAEALERLPALATAAREGRLFWSVVRELVRVATAETEQAWLDAADGETAREVEALVAGRLPGDHPDDPASDAARDRRLVLEVSASTYALFGQARRRLVEEVGHSVEDDELVKLLCERSLATAARDDGRSSYQIAITMCASCNRATQRGAGAEVRVEPDVLEEALCDAQLIGRVDQPAPARATQTVPPKKRREVVARHGGCCAVPGCRNSILHVHHTELRSEGGTHDADKLVPLCSVHHRMTHVGRLVIRGSYSKGFVFDHADGTPYGGASLDTVRADLLASAHRALRNLGYKEKEARAALDQIATHVGQATPLADVITAALRTFPNPGSAAHEELAIYERTCSPRSAYDGLGCHERTCAPTSAAHGELAVYAVLASFLGLAAQQQPILHARAS